MNLLPESNNLYKISHKEKLPKLKFLKLIVIVIASIFLLGFLSQTIGNFIGNEKIQSRVNYTKVDNKKIEYSMAGKGDYTIVFIGATGTTLYSWDNIAKATRDDLKAITFVYNRGGYGFSDSGAGETIEQQAQDLKIVLRKAGAADKVILVGEEYGGLVAESFANQYPNSVSGMVLINSFDENKLESDDFKKQIAKSVTKAKYEVYGSYFNVTRILNSAGLADTVPGIEENLSDTAKQEYEIQKNQSKYRNSIYSELQNLQNYDGNIEQEGSFAEKPLYIITRDDDQGISKIGSPELTTTYKEEDETNLTSIDNSGAISNGISSVLKDVKKIDKKAKTK